MGLFLYRVHSLHGCRGLRLGPSGAPCRLVRGLQPAPHAELGRRRRALLHLEPHRLAPGL